MSILEVRDLEVVYRITIQVLRGMSLDLQEHQIVALLGPNGSGKSTTLKAISGLLYTEEGKVTKGTIKFRGESIVGKSPDEIVRLGIVQVVQGRMVFQQLTVEENLKVVGLFHKKSSLRNGFEAVYQLFPRLRDLRHQTSGYLSGGEQQMLVLGRCLMSEPAVMLLDEPSLGLSPRLIEEIHAAIKQINQERDIPIILVEQNAWAALNIADYAYVIDVGRVVAGGPSEVVRNDKDALEFHLGISEQGQRRSYWDVKHYKRRQRWLG